MIRTRRRRTPTNEGPRRWPPPPPPASPRLARIPGNPRARRPPPARRGRAGMPRNTASRARASAFARGSGAGGSPDRLLVRGTRGHGRPGIGAGRRRRLGVRQTPSRRDHRGPAGLRAHRESPGPPTPPGRIPACRGRGHGSPPGTAQSPATAPAGRCHQAKVAIGGLVGEDADRPGPVLGGLIALQDRIRRWASDTDKADARDRLWAELHRHRSGALAVVEERGEARSRRRQPPTRPTAGSTGRRPAGLRRSRRPCTRRTASERNRACSSEMPSGTVKQLASACGTRMYSACEPA